MLVARGLHQEAAGAKGEEHGENHALLAKGLECLHRNGVLHRDIKPDNVLVFSFDLVLDVNGKLTDFGSSRNINLLMTNMTFTKGVWTPTYMAPEVLNKEKYKKAADVFSFGVMLYQCIVWCHASPKATFKFTWQISPRHWHEQPCTDQGHERWCLPVVSLKLLGHIMKSI